MSDTNAKKKKFNRYYGPVTLKILFGSSGNECAEPTCSNRLIASKTEQSDAAVVSQIAHIYALSDDGPRGKPGLTQEERNHHTNLLLLCPTHHTNVDTQHETYPATMVRGWKEKHERKFSDQLSAQISDIGFHELEVAAKAVMAASAEPTGTPELPLTPTEKIAKNELSTKTTGMIRMGAAKSHDVEAVILQAEQLDVSFPDRLRAGFQQKYLEFRSEGLLGDDLFDALYVWSGGKNSDPQRQAGGLCILSHLFILCDVFES